VTTERSVAVSADRMEMTIRTPDGRLATLRSARPHGFTDEDVERAQTVDLNTGMVLGQVNRARRVQIRGRAFLLHVNTGPPTWWWPRIEIRRDHVMIGWYRALAALSWSDSGR
jgi:hypothetical protein